VVSGPDELTEHARANREFWDGYVDRYQELNDEFIDRTDLRWGMWQIPDAELGVLGDVSGLDVLELGCGAGQFGAVLAGLGARLVGIDNSEKQLAYARKRFADAGLEAELHHVSAESLPFEDGRFDLVVADHGANRFADPYLWVPECARVLRPGGVLAFSGGTPFEVMCVNPETDSWDATLRKDWFGMHKQTWDDGAVEFELTYGDWIRLFRANRFAIEALVEGQPPEGAASTYRNEAETAWARRWPMEQIWKVRKEGS